jgi:hypothetical protein
MIKKSHLAAAQSLTTTSVVNSMSGLVAWYETSLENSFIESEMNDGGSISTWYDRNSQAVNKNNATQATNTNQPKFYINIFEGGIPAIRFDGTNDFMTFDGSALANSSYTIFVIEQRRANSSSNYFLGGTTSSSNANLHLGYRDNTTLAQAHYSNDMDVIVSGYSSPIPKMHTFQFDTTNGKRYWLNGGSNADSTSAGQTTALTAYVGSAIGRYASNYFNGDIAEIIIFKRLLRSDERRSIEDYLSKKFNIPIS